MTVYHVIFFPLSEAKERQRTVRFADEVEQSEDLLKGSNTSSIQDFLLKMAGQPLPENQVWVLKSV